MKSQFWYTNVKPKFIWVRIGTEKYEQQRLDNLSSIIGNKRIDTNEDVRRICDKKPSEKHKDKRLL